MMISIIKSISSYIYLFFPAESTSTNYNVVDTDYENFAVVYSCNNKLFFKSGNNLDYIAKVLLEFYLITLSWHLLFSYFKIEYLFSEILWILTRKQFPSPYLIKDIKKRIRHYGLDTRRLKRTNQKGCPRIHWISYD